MKKSVLFAAVGFMVMALSACNGQEEVVEPAVEEVVEDVAEGVVEEVVEDVVEEIEEEDLGEVGMPNPWSDSSEEEAATAIAKGFVAPEGAENIEWSKMDADENTLYQMTFDLNGLTYTAREKVTGDTEEDISGMYYEWTVEEDTTLDNWADGNMTGKLYRYIGDDEWADLCTWYDVEIGISYSLSVTSNDLDGFDITAVVADMCD